MKCVQPLAISFIFCYRGFIETDIIPECSEGTPGVNRKSMLMLMMLMMAMVL